MKANRDWKQLSEEISKFRNTFTLRPKYIFRGQARSEWGLEPSLTRIVKSKHLTRAKALQLELEAVNKFSISGSSLAPLEHTVNLNLVRLTYNNFRTIDYIGWMSLMQHFGAPTRTLDWTISPWAALYFACCESTDYDGSLWVAEFSKVMDHAEKAIPNVENQFSNQITRVDSPDAVVIITPENTNQRIESQRALFTICTNPLKDHYLVLNESAALTKIEISKDLKTSIMLELNQMNITANSLFPGLDGLGKSVTEFCRLWDESSIIK